MCFYVFEIGEIVKIILILDGKSMFFFFIKYEWYDRVEI